MKLLILISTLPLIRSYLGFLKISRIKLVREIKPCIQTKIRDKIKAKIRDKIKAKIKARIPTGVVRDEASAEMAVKASKIKATIKIATIRDHVITVVLGIKIPINSIYIRILRISLLNGERKINS